MTSTVVTSGPAVVIVVEVLCSVMMGAVVDVGVVVVCCLVVTVVTVAPVGVPTAEASRIICVEWKLGRWRAFAENVRER